MSRNRSDLGTGSVLVLAGTSGVVARGGRKRAGIDGPVLLVALSDVRRTGQSLYGRHQGASAICGAALPACSFPAPSLWTFPFRQTSPVPASASRARIL